MIPKAPGADCENCPLKDQPYVPSDGPERAEIVIVGEAPGYEEVRAGKPFIGASGKLLDTVLEHNGIERSGTFVTNVCLCRPEGNATPDKASIAACSNRLRNEITAREPKVVVALGATAAGAIMGKSVAITKFRAGPSKESENFPGVRVIPTIHPAACLREAGYFPSFQADIQKIKGTDAIRIGWESPTYRVFDTPDQAKQALRELPSRSRDYVIDIEVGAEKDTDFSRPDKAHLLCVGVGYARGRVAVFGEGALADAGVRSMLGKLLGQHGTQLIAHNGKFDLAGLEVYLDTKLGLDFDTMLASYCMDERPGTHGLKYLAGEILGVPDYSKELDQYTKGKGGGWNTIPKDVLYKYNAYDVACTYELWRYYESELSPQLRDLHDYLVHAGEALRQMEKKGVSVDEVYLAELDVDFTNLLGDIERGLYRWVDNPRSPKQVKESLLALGAPVESTNADTLEDLAEALWLNKRGPRSDELEAFVNAMLMYRKEHKSHATYVKGIQERLHNGRVFPTFLLHGTTTGRLSCRNPNLQNITRGAKLRGMFVPSPGRIFVQADYSQAEMRVVASLAQDRYLQDIFNSGRDIHGENASRIFGPNYTKEQRVYAKRIVFGLAYNLSAYGLAKHLHVSQQEAQKYLSTFFTVIPDTVAWKENLRQEILHNGDDLVTPFGRHRRFYLITAENQKDVINEGTAFYPQSIASDLCLQSLIKLVEAGVDCRISVHDSILAESDPKDAQELGHYMAEVMQATAAEFTDFVKFPADVGIGTRWGAL